MVPAQPRPLLTPPPPAHRTVHAAQGRDKLSNDLNGRFEPFIGAYFVRNVTISTNSSGIIDGGGLAWWAAKAAGLLNNTPPHLFEAGWSSHVTIGAPPGSALNALILESSPFWNVHLYDRCAPLLRTSPLRPRPLAPSLPGHIPCCAPSPACTSLAHPFPYAARATPLPLQRLVARARRVHLRGRDCGQHGWFVVASLL